MLGEVVLCDAAHPEDAFCLELAIPPLAIAFNPTSQYRLVTAGEDGTISF